MLRNFYTTLILIFLAGEMVYSIAQTESLCALHLSPANKNQNAYMLMMRHDSVRIMSKEILSNKDCGITQTPLRPFYNHSFRIGTGYSLNTTRMDNSMQTYTDTSEHTFNVAGHTPTFSLGYSCALDSTFTLGFTMAYASSEIYFDNQFYGSKFFYFSFNPQLHIFRSYNFEYYMKLKVGVSYERNHLDMVPSERIQNLYPTGFHMFTGVTIAGINYLINDNLALNTEISIWSPETVSMGLSYRFYKKKEVSEPAEIGFGY